MSHLSALDDLPPPDEQQHAPTSTTFQPVTSTGEQHSGTNLVVASYAFLWVLLMGWLVLMWRKQAMLHAKIDGLEKAIDRAAAKNETK